MNRPWRGVMAGLPLLKYSQSVVSVPSFKHFIAPLLRYPARHNNYVAVACLAGADELRLADEYKAIGNVEGR